MLPLPSGLAPERHPEVERSRILPIQPRGEAIEASHSPLTTAGAVTRWDACTVSRERTSTFALSETVAQVVL